MSATVGSLNVNATIQTAAFDKALDSMQGKLKGLQKSYANVGAKMSSIGKTLSIGITAPFAAFAAKGISEARETAAAMAQVNAALTSMGPVAGKTAAQLEKAANAFEGSSLYEGDQILKDVTANLLTFGNIGGAAFDQAQQAALDLATRMDGDLKGAALLVGKALNDPIKGMGALGKAGIQFSTDQKAAIKAFVDTGNAAGAQNIILGEFQKQFGGAAAAAQNADPFNKLNDAFNSLAESLGTILLPFLTQAAEYLSGLAEKFQALSPETQKWVAIIGGTLAVAGPVLVVLGSMVTAIGALAPLVGGLATAFGALKVAFTLARVAALATLPALVPFLVPLAAIAAAVGVAYLAWKNFDKIKEIAARVVGYAQALYTGVKTWLVDKMSGIIKIATAPFRAVTEAARLMWDKVVGHSYVPDMVSTIGSEMAKLDALMVAPAKAATGKTAEAFRTLSGEVSALLDRLFPEEAAFRKFQSELATIDDGVKRLGLSLDVAARARERLTNEFMPSDPILQGVDDIDLSGGGDPSAILSPDIPTLQSSGAALSAMLDQISPALQRISDLGTGAFGRIAGAIKDSVLPAIQAMQDKSLSAGDKIAAMGNALSGLFTSIFGKKWGGILGAVSQIGLAFASKGGLKLARGGAVRGPGTSKSDSIPARLSDGEYVINAKAAKGVGLPFLNALNFGSLRGLSMGGPAMPSLSSRVGGGLVSPGTANEGRRSRVEIIPSPYFDVKVDGIIQQRVPGMVGRGVLTSVGASSMVQERKFKRQIP